MSHRFENLEIGGNAQAHLGDKITQHYVAVQSTPNARRALFQANGIISSDERESLEARKGEITPGTCSWILADKRYTTWKESRSQLLRISGGPGRGKTMLSMFLTKHHDEQCRSDPGNRVSLYYFCQAGVESCNNDLAVLQGLVLQLYDLCPRLRKYVDQEFETMHDQLFTRFRRLWSCFKTMVEDKTLTHVYCVVDGFDECKRNGYDSLLNSFINMCTSEQRESRLSLLLVGREVLKDELGLRLLETAECIRLDEDLGVRGHLKRDLDLFVNTKIKRLEMKCGDPGVCSHVREKLRSNSEETFLWVGYVARKLLDTSTPRIVEMLDSFPAGLEELYLRILQQIPSEQRNAAVQVIQWVAIAFRPLSLAELAVAVDKQTGPLGYPSPIASLESDIVYCNNFLQISGGPTLQNKIVRFPHQSARDYLTLQLPPEFADFRIVEDRAHGVVAEKLLDRLETPTADSQLHEYARRYWFEHFTASASAGYCSFNDSRPFYGEDSATREAWWERYRHDSPGLLGWDYGSAPRLSMFHIACHLGLLPLVKKLLPGQQALDELSPADPSKRTGLMWAIQQPKSRVAMTTTNNEVVKLLINEGADVRFQDTKDRTPLHLVIRNAGRISNVTEMMQLLITNGAVTSAKDDLGSTPLHNAARFGHADAVKHLLDHRVDVNARRTNLQTPLHESVMSNSIECVDLLIRAGADVNAQDDRGITPLIEASGKAQADVAKLLVELGAKVNLAGNDKTTPLHVAALKGCREIVELLKSKGADLEAQDSTGKIPGDYAYRDSREDILRALYPAEPSRSASPTSPLSNGQVSPDGLESINDQIHRSTRVH